MKNLIFKELNNENLVDFKEDLSILYKKFNQFYIDNNYNKYLEKRENDQIDFAKMILADSRSQNLIGWIVYDVEKPIALYTWLHRKVIRIFHRGICWIY